MLRTFDSMDLVQLPRLDAAAAQALGRQVLVAAKGVQLPEAVAEALAEVAAAHTALERAVAGRVPGGPPAPTRTKAADRALDAAWSALYDVVRGWSRVADHRLGSVATGLLPQLFPDGVRFLLSAFKVEWAESTARLRLIKEQSLEGDLDKLGCGALLDRIRSAHKEYGEALGVTAPETDDASGSSIRDAMNTFSGALRDYIVRVAASVSKRDPKSRALADELLAPIREWESLRSAAAVVTSPENPPSPAPAAPAAQAVAPPPADEPATKH